MVYAMAVSAVLVVPVYKPLRKSLAVGFGIILLVYLFVEGPVYHGILKIQPGDAREALSVPRNQWNPNGSHEPNGKGLYA